MINQKATVTYLKMLPQKYDIQDNEDLELAWTTPGLRARSGLPPLFIQPT
jgi:hypothetical protein